MKKLLILIVFTAVYLHFYPQEKLTLWYEEYKNALLDTFTQSTDTKVRLKAQKIYQELEPKFKQFKASEQEYLKTITSNRKSLLDFYTQYCETPKANALLHAKNQVIVCNKIQQYQSLF